MQSAAHFRLRNLHAPHGEPAPVAIRPRMRNRKGGKYLRAMHTGGLGKGALIELGVEGLFGDRVLIRVMNRIGGQSRVYL